MKYVAQLTVDDSPSYLKTRYDVCLTIDNKIYKDSFESNYKSREYGIDTSIAVENMLILFLKDHFIECDYNTESYNLLPKTQFMSDDVIEIVRRKTLHPNMVIEIPEWFYDIKHLVCSGLYDMLTIPSVMKHIIGIENLKENYPELFI